MEDFRAVVVFKEAVDVRVPVVDKAEEEVV